MSTQFFEHLRDNLKITIHTTLILGGPSVDLNHFIGQSIVDLVLVWLMIDTGSHSGMIYKVNLSIPKNKDWYLLLFVLLASMTRSLQIFLT